MNKANHYSAKLSLRDFRHPRLWLGSWGALIILVVWASLADISVPPVQIPSGDKWGHLLAYATLSGWGVGLFRTRRAHGLAVLAFIVMGVALEFMQDLTPHRTFDMRDALANTGGALLGFSLGWTPMARWLERADRWLFSAR